MPPDLASRLAPVAGLRNVIVHDYLETDLELLAAGVNIAADDFDAYATALARWLERLGDDPNTTPAK